MNNRSIVSGVDVADLEYKLKENQFLNLPGNKSMGKNSDQNLLIYNSLGFSKDGKFLFLISS